MQSRSQPPERSILVTRPTNEFYGLYAAIKQRRPFLFFEALMTVASEFFPVLLSNVPYTITQVEISPVISARITSVLLFFMLVTLGASFFIRWPYLPVDPRSIAGAMYYVTDSYLISSFDGVSLLDRKDKDTRVGEMGRRYYYGDVIGRSGRRRMGVDTDVSLTNDVDTAYRGFRMDREQLQYGPGRGPAPMPAMAPVQPGYQHDGQGAQQQQLPQQPPGMMPPPGPAQPSWVCPAPVPLPTIPGYGSFGEYRGEGPPR